jgi:hypothetical protein
MRSTPLVVAALLCVAALGCRNKAPVESVPVAPGGDAGVLVALDPYEPIYLTDADGRVVNLKLPNRHIPAALMAEIGKLSELETLDLFGTSVTDEGLAHIRNLQKLSRLGLGDTPITDAGLLHLQPLKGLRHTWLPKQRLSEGAIEKLKEACPQLGVH